MSIITTIDLLRHGDVAGGCKLLGHSDEPLSDLGWRQMRAATARKPAPWKKIISSPLRRCAEFGGKLAAEDHLPLAIENDIKEMGFGEWDGCWFSDLYLRHGEQLNRFWADPRENPAPRGEAYAAFETRVCSAWERLIDAHAGEHVLVICHGGPIRIILRYLLEFPARNIFQVEVPYASVSRIQIKTGHKPKLVFHGSAA